MKYDKYWKKVSDAMQVVDAERIKAQKVYEHYQRTTRMPLNEAEAGMRLRHLDSAVGALNDALNHLEKS